MQVIGLGVVTRDDGGWDVVVSRQGAAPALGSVPRPTVEAVQQIARRLLAPPSSWQDQDWRTHEARMGRALAAVIEQAGPPAAAWARAIGRAETLAEPLAVLVDTPSALQSLPWELLGVSPDAPPLETLGLGCVIRLSGGAGRVRGGQATAEVLVSRLGNHPVLTCVHEAITVACHHGRTSPPRSVPVDPGATRVVSLLVDEDRAGLLDASVPTDGDPESTVVEGAELVWLAVCGASVHAAPAPPERARRLLRHGTAAVLDGDIPLDVEGATALARGLHEALLQGGDLLGATVAARASVRNHRVASPGGRWWRHRLWIAQPADLALRPWGERSSPQLGWPAPAPCAAELLGRATVYAELAGTLGVEQLAEGLLDHAPPELSTLQARISRHRGHLGRAMGGLSLRTQPGPVRPTPRLARVARSMPPGFTARMLWDALLAERWAWGRWLAEDGASGPVGAALGMEVLGGPEDGRRLALHPGDVIGRDSTRKPCDVPLYARTHAFDARLSRRHLRWLGDGWVHLLAPADALERPDGRQDGPFGQLEVQAGDLLQLTPSTWLVAVDVPTVPRQGVLTS
ncbi:MAG: hypothetical protein H6732_14955 [Alphaproteobacteria bacterium]|nr:hypothetical protein [Alphaproteobacteria bacterium]